MMMTSNWLSYLFPSANAACDSDNRTIRNSILAWLTALVVTAGVQAGTISIVKTQKLTTPATTSNPTAFAGYVTDTYTAVSDDPTDKIVGFDFVGDGTSKGFFGPMSQVNPFGLATV